MPAETNVRAIRSFSAWGLAVLPGAFLQTKLWTPVELTNDPHWHRSWCGTHRDDQTQPQTNTQSWAWVHFARSNATQSTNWLTQSNPIHDTHDPCSGLATHIQSNPSNPRRRKQFHLCSRNLFSILNWCMQSMTWITNSNKNSSQLVMQQLTSNESRKIWTRWQSDKAMTMKITIKITTPWPNPIHGWIQSMSNSALTASSSSRRSHKWLAWQKAYLHCEARKQPRKMLCSLRMWIIIIIIIVI